jgi:hypothetical protein
MVFTNFWWHSDLKISKCI